MEPNILLAVAMFGESAGLLVCVGLILFDEPDMPRVARIILATMLFVVAAAVSAAAIVAMRA